ncbi:MAG: DUF1553 domain-containing protein, partial [Verrucomicrobiota bacterium]
TARFAILLTLGSSPWALSSEGIAFFESEVRPVLAKHCYECHSEEAGKQKGGLWLDRREGWQVGGDSGPVIIPGNPEESLFLHSLTHEDRDLEMPPKEKLPDHVIDDLHRWVAMGAPDPRTELSMAKEGGVNLEEGREFWSFQPIANPDIPPVQNVEWPLDPIDHFLLAKLEEAELVPNDEASRETLLRRLTIDLTGLPPTVEEQHAFLSDSSTKAYETVVDRLLSSKAFGERWGRHWLDIARYADSSGGGRSLPLPEAWRFRDYVIRSFHEDRPLDQLIREHIAGDLLAHRDDEAWVDQVVGTGFLVLGPNNYENQDKELLDFEIVDEQVDTIGRAFLGMTIGCARCHDHKFDPIPTRDYYSLAGIFTSTKFVNHANVSRWHQQPLPPTPQQQKALQRYQEEDEEIRAVLAQTKKKLAALGVSSGNLEKSVSTGALNGIVVDQSQAEVVGDWKESVVVARFVGENYIHDQKLGQGTKRVLFRPEIETTGDYEVRVSYTAGANRSARVPITIRHGYGQEVVSLNQKLKPEIDGLYQSVGQFRFHVGTQGTIEISNRGTDDGVVIVDSVQLIKPKSATFRDVANESAVLSPEIEALKEDLAALEERRKKHGERKPKLPMAMAVGEAEASRVGDIPIRIRGEVRNLGEVAPRGFLRVTLPVDAPDAPTLEGSGRRELAEWIVSPENPLTARVLVNRIWLHLFGEGIVRTPDNFGTTGQLPTHPELLDHLANRLVESGWSTKTIVRDLLLSRAYRMSSETSRKGLKEDEENRFLWRMHRRRLDAETIRDSVLLISGQLDLDGGGPSLPAGFKSEYGHQFTTKKRSVYVPVFRNELYELFSTFGFANPNFAVGRREQSTIPTQSLFLMNSSFIHEQARAAVASLWQVSGEEERLKHTFRRVLARKPSAAEKELSLSFLREQIASEGEAIPAHAWESLVRGLIASVDFQYIR